MIDEGSSSSILRKTISDPQTGIIIRTAVEVAVHVNHNLNPDIFPLCKDEKAHLDDDCCIYLFVLMYLISLMESGHISDQIKSWNNTNEITKHTTE